MIVGLAPGDVVVFDGFGEKEYYEVMGHPYTEDGEGYVEAVSVRIEFYSGETTTLNTEYISLTAD